MTSNSYNFRGELVEVADRLTALVAALVEVYGAVSRPAQRAGQAKRLVERLVEDLDHERSGAS